MWWCEMSRHIKNTRYNDQCGKRRWHNRRHFIDATRIGPDAGARLSYQLTWPGGWGVIDSWDIEPMIKMLEGLQADAERRRA